MEHVTQYRVIEHFNSNRRRHEGKRTMSQQIIRVGPRAVDVKRAERAKKKADKAAAVTAS